MRRSTTAAATSVRLLMLDLGAYHPTAGTGDHATPTLEVARPMIGTRDMERMPVPHEMGARVVRLAVTVTVRASQQGHQREQRADEPHSGCAICGGRTPLR